MKKELETMKSKVLLFLLFACTAPKYTDNLDVLAFLQKNADQVYAMKNDAGIIWCDWTTPSQPQAVYDQGGYTIFGMYNAFALLYNSLPWW